MPPIIYYGRTCISLLLLITIPRPQFSVLCTQYYYLLMANQNTLKHAVETQTSYYILVSCVFSEHRQLILLTN